MKEDKQVFGVITKATDLLIYMNHFYTQSHHCH